MGFGLYKGTYEFEKYHIRPQVFELLFESWVWGVALTIGVHKYWWQIHLSKLMKYATKN